MMSTIAFIVKHWRSVGVGALVVLFAAMLALQKIDHVRELHRAAVAAESAVVAGKAETRDSLARAAARVVDSLQFERVAAEKVLRSAKAASDAEHRRVLTRLASNAATDSLYASLKRLSDSAKVDTTVTALSRASVAVAAENDTLRTDMHALIATHAIERAAADSLHSADTAAIRGLAGSLVGVRDSLAVEAKKPKRTKKALLIAYAVGRGLEFAVGQTVKALVNR